MSLWGRKKNNDCYGKKKKIKRRLLVKVTLPVYFCLIYEIWKGFKNMSEKLERDFQRQLKKDIEKRFDGCLVMKMDSGQIQGIPDLLVLYKDKWATLECKKDSKASKRPNQEYYVNKMNDMSFSRFINPENKEEVLDELQRAFKS